MKEKNMRILNKVFTVILLILLIVSFSSSVFARDPGSYTGTETSQFDSLGNRIIGMIQAIGSIAAVAILVVLGIKYMMGSTEEKAEYKKTMLPYLIGAILIFAASNIASMVYNFANELD